MEVPVRITGPPDPERGNPESVQLRTRVVDGGIPIVGRHEYAGDVSNQPYPKNVWEETSGPRGHTRGQTQSVDPGNREVVGLHLAIKDVLDRPCTAHLREGLPCHSVDSHERPEV